MITETPSAPAILKGADFTERLTALCRGDLPVVAPLDGRRYSNILIPHLVGGELPFALHGVIGQALRMRGATVTALLCDGFLPACVCRKVDHYESACTRWCHRNAGPFAQALGLPVRWHSEFITAEEIAECDHRARSVAAAELPFWQAADISYGPLIVQSVESFFRVGKYDPTDAAMAAKARDFLRSAMYVTVIAERALDELHIDKVLTDCGQQVEWGVFRAVAVRRGLPVDVVNVGLRGNALKVETDRPGEPTRQVPGWEAWRDLPLTEAQETALDDYLRRRETVPYEFKDEKWQGRIREVDEVRRIISLPKRPRGRVLAMFPNVGFDAGKTKTRPAFDHAADWVVETVNHFRPLRDHHLIVKVHPGELHRAALDPVVNMIARRCHPLPRNVHVIGPASGVTAHSILRLADAALVYTSTVAAEAVGLNKAVVLVGGGRHAGHGVTIDVTSPEQYFGLLDAVCVQRHVLEPPGELGRRYAYAVFFRADIPIGHFRMFDIYVADFTMASLADVSPGRDRYIDAVCRGVLFDEPFENPDAQHPNEATAAR